MSQFITTGLCLIVAIALSRLKVPDIRWLRQRIHGRVSRWRSRQYSLSSYNDRWRQTIDSSHLFIRTLSTWSFPHRLQGNHFLFLHNFFPSIPPLGFLRFLHNEYLVYPPSRRSSTPCFTGRGLQQLSRIQLNLDKVFFFSTIINLDLSSSPLILSLQYCASVSFYQSGIKRRRVQKIVFEKSYKDIVEREDGCFNDH